MSIPGNALALASQGYGYAAVGSVDPLTRSLEACTLERGGKRQAVATPPDDGLQAMISSSLRAVEDPVQQEAALVALTKVQALITSCFKAIHKGGFYSRSIADQKYGFWVQWDPQSGEVACLANSDCVQSASNVILPGSMVVDVYYKRTGALRIDWKKLKEDLKRCKLVPSKMALDTLRLGAKVLGAACWAKVSKGYGSRHFEGGIDEERLQSVQANTGVILETWKRVINTCMKHAPLFPQLVEESSQDRASKIHRLVKNLLIGAQLLQQKSLLSLHSMGAKPTFSVRWHPLSGEIECLPMSGSQVLVEGTKVVEIRCIKTGKLKIDWDRLTDELYTTKTTVSIFALKMLQVARKSLQKVYEMQKSQTGPFREYNGFFHAEAASQLIQSQKVISKIFDAVTKNCLRRPSVLFGLSYASSPFDDKVGELAELFAGRIIRIERSQQPGSQLARVDYVMVDSNTTTVMLNVSKARAMHEGRVHVETLQKPLVHREGHSQVINRQIW